MSATMKANAAVLPSHLQELERYFSAMESSLDMLSRRYKSIPFFALKAAIEATMKKTFSVDLLTRIMIVFPEACVLNSTGPLFLAPVERNQNNPFEFGTMKQARRQAFRCNVVKYIEDCFMAYKQNGGTDFDVEKHVPLINVSDSSSFFESRSPLNTLTYLGQETKRLSGPNKRMIAEVENVVPIVDAPNCIKKQQHGLKGLPASLLAKVQQRAKIENQMKPEALLERQRKQARLALPSFLNMVYLYFRTNRKSKVNIDMLVQNIVNIHGANSYGPAVSSSASKFGIVREQLEMLLEMIPEWCFTSESVLTEGKTLFHINGDADIGKVRHQLMGKLH